MMIVGKEIAKTDRRQPSGEWVKIGVEWYYKIRDAQLMPDFFMGIVSASNHWMFIGSNGGLTAGRKNPDHALFPYYTSDKILENAHNTGSFTAIRVEEEGQTLLWEPFSPLHRLLYPTTINLYKNIPGNKLVFEAVNHHLNLAFSYSWTSSRRYGFVREARLENTGSQTREMTILDGVQNVLPSGLTEALQNSRSNLVDAYKKQERVSGTNLGIFRLSSIIIDRPMPAEALSCNVFYTTLTTGSKLLLSPLQIDKFRAGLPLVEEAAVKGEKGAFLLELEAIMASGEHREWLLAGDVDLDHAALAALLEELKDPEKLTAAIRADVDMETDNLNRIVGAGDGLQLGADKKNTGRHYGNVLFNLMRGGLFDDQYFIPASDFSTYIQRSNRGVFEAASKFLSALPAKIHLRDLLEFVRHTGNKDLERLTLDYLPLYFSRRHGDPSRPWNRFSIAIAEEDTASRIHYEGNWRDIFQNWEALLFSYPGFIQNVLSRFVNASTIDGYNPYKIGSFGIDWERTDPEDPWSFIGYWGDHQIIYLLKILEEAANFQSRALQRMLNDRLFVFADVPYRIRSYEEIVQQPKETIDYDPELEREIQERVRRLGTDGKLVFLPTGEIYRVSFAEKLLLTLLTKMSNFVPDGGIWLNTQRPEWNDANNALVGNGLSMVTLYYMHRYVQFLSNLVEAAKDETFEVSADLMAFFSGITEVLEVHASRLHNGLSPAERKVVTDELGQVGAAYRSRVYNRTSNPRFEHLSKEALLDFCASALNWFSASIENNRRSDGLYHAYNLMTYAQTGIEISYLYEMLEGQVAVLSSGFLEASEADKVLTAMRGGPLYRADQHSYLLYPDRALPDFLSMNCIPEEQVRNSDLLTELLDSGDKRLVVRDVTGVCHFNARFKNGEDLLLALKELSHGPYAVLVERDREKVLDLFESLFHHHAFTGRSGTFFGYEGLGSIYWHMVSKLLLAVQEVYFAAVAKKEASKLRQALAAHYYDVRAGLGWEKDPLEYGAFPMDPYSHTPAQRGAQQPGMTGQVKEDVLVRLGEIGVHIANSRLHFRPWLFRSSELLNEEAVFTWYDLDDNKRSLVLQKGSFAFTYCQVPVIYLSASKNEILVLRKDGSRERLEGLDAGDKVSLELFERSGTIDQLHVSINFEDWH